MAAPGVGGHGINTYQDALNAYTSLSGIKSFITKTAAILAGIATCGAAYKAVFTWMVKSLADLPPQAAGTAAKVGLLNPVKPPNNNNAASSESSSDAPSAASSLDPLPQNFESLIFDNNHSTQKLVADMQPGTYAIRKGQNENTYKISVKTNIGVNNILFSVEDGKIKSSSLGEFNSLDEFLGSLNAIAQMTPQSAGRVQAPFNQTNSLSTAQAQALSPSQVHTISAQEAENILNMKSEGDYLIRGFKGVPNQFMLSVNTNSKNKKNNYIKNHVLFTIDKDGTIKSNWSQSFGNLDSLLSHYKAMNRILPLNAPEVSPDELTNEEIANFEKFVFDEKTAMRDLLKDMPVGVYAVKKSKKPRHYNLSVVTDVDGSKIAIPFNFRMNRDRTITDLNYSKNYDNITAFFKEVGAVYLKRAESTPKPAQNLVRRLVSMAPKSAHKEAREILKTKEEGSFTILHDKDEFFILNVKTGKELTSINFKVVGANLVDDAGNAFTKPMDFFNKYGAINLILARVIDEAVADKAAAQASIASTDNTNKFDLNNLAHNPKSSTRFLVQGKPAGTFAIRRTDDNNVYNMTVNLKGKEGEARSYLVSFREDNGKIIDLKRGTEFSSLDEFLESYGATNPIVP